MGWVKLDDGFFRNRKVVDLSKDAKLLFLAGLTYAAEQLTDGHLSPRAVRVVTAVYADVDEEVVKELVDVDLWHEPGHGCPVCPIEIPPGAYYVHAYLEFNPTAQAEKERRQQNRTRRELHSDPALVGAIRKRDRDRCRYCGSRVSWKDRRGPLGATYDHVDPRGGNTLENVVVACRGCNAAKGSRTPERAGMRLLEPGASSGSRSGPSRTQARSGPEPSHPSQSPYPYPRARSGSTSDTTSPLPQGGEEEVEPVLRLAAQLLAERKLERRGPDQKPIVDRERWLKRVTTERANLHRPTALAILEREPATSADQLADELEPELRPKGPAWVPCGDCDNGLVEVEQDGETRYLPCPCRSAT